MSLHEDDAPGGPRRPRGRQGAARRTEHRLRGNDGDTGQAACACAGQAAGCHQQGSARQAHRARGVRENGALECHQGSGRAGPRRVPPARGGGSGGQHFRGRCGRGHRAGSGARRAHRGCIAGRDGSGSRFCSGCCRRLRGHRGGARFRRAAVPAPGPDSTRAGSGSRRGGRHGRRRGRGRIPVGRSAGFELQRDLRRVFRRFLRGGAGRRGGSQRPVLEAPPARAPRAGARPWRTERRQAAGRAKPG